MSDRLPRPGPVLRFCVVTPLLLLAVTALDSAWLAQRFEHGQAVAAGVTLLGWAWFYRRSGARLRRVLVLGLLPATVGEVVFSLGLGMYDYRLHAVPLYVPPGHVILYATVFGLVHDGAVRQAERWLAPLLFALGGGYAVGWHLLVGDAFGLACWGAFAVLWLVNRPGRLFFAAMFLLVAFLEQCGTRLGCWRWPETWLGHPALWRSGNPPGGIAVFYVAFDLACLALYFFWRWPSFERWVGRRVVAHSKSRQLFPSRPR